MTTNSQKPIRIGPYVVGEIPLPSVFSYELHGGGPVVITGYTAEVVIAPTGDPGSAVTRAASVTDGPNGEVTYSWSALDLTAEGPYELQFWVGNGGTRRLCSPKHIFDVKPASGTAPAI